MNIKSNKIKINPAFENLFQFKSKEEQIEHDAQMISYRILSQVEKICEQRKIKKKDLADMVGTSRSYVTQLFRGTKHVNTFIMAKFEDALQVSFEIRLKDNEESHEEFISKLLTKDIIEKKKFHSNGFRWYCVQDKTEEQADTNALIVEMDKEQKKMERNVSYSQIAG